MVQTTMYPAKVNSPELSLKSAITTTGQTSIVVSGSVSTKFPSSPNLLVIGTGEDAETIRFTQVPTGNDIDGWTYSNVERGFQGSPNTWAAGTVVSRLFTAYDHDTFKSNIEDLATKIVPATTRSTTLFAYTSIVPFTNGCTLFQLDTELNNDFPVPFGIYQGGASRGVEKLNWITHIDEDWDASTVQLQLSAMTIITGSGIGEWNIYAIRIPSAATMGTSFGSPVATITTTHANQFYLVKNNGSATIGGSGNHILWEIRRGTSSDTFVGSVMFVSMRVEYGVV